MTEFVNPYNFIPFEEEGPMRPDTKTMEAYKKPADLLSGWMDVLLTPKTSLIITDGIPWDTKEADARKVSSDDNETHRFYRFYRTPDGKMAIPGSSLRGMLRSVYEAASNSCLPFLLNDSDITLRTPTYAAFKKRGLLGYDKGTDTWRLYHAVEYTIDDPIYSNSTDIPYEDIPENQRVRKVIRGGLYYTGPNRSGVSYSCGQRVYFIPDGYHAILTNDTNQEVGWLQFNKPVGLSKEKIPNEDRYPAYHIRVLTKGEEVEIGDESRKYNDFYNDYRIVLESTNTDEARSLKKKLKDVRTTGEGMVPVWFSIVTREKEKIELIYLSAGSIGRVYQKRKWENVMELYTPCDQKEGLCPACLLFGTVKANGWKGRVRFGDALPVSICENPEWITLPILSSPKPSAFEFYLRRPYDNATYWNYDYYSIGNQENSDYFDLEKATPRGRKMYWHSGMSQGKQNVLGADVSIYQSKLNATMEALPAGERNVFNFRIYFDCITEQQLEQLKWIITFGENDFSSTLQHKLGHGKPLGYGSVKLKVDQIRLRKVSDFEHMPIYQICPPKQEEYGKNSPWQKAGKEPKRIMALKSIANTKSTRGQIVAYPLRKKGSAITVFNWFAYNRQNANGLRTLPNPTENIHLHSNVSEEEFKEYPWNALSQATGRVQEQRRVDRRNGDTPRAQNPGNHGRDNHDAVQRTTSHFAETRGTLVGKNVEGVVTGFHSNGSAYVSLEGGKRGFIQQQRTGQRLDSMFGKGDHIKVYVFRYDSGYDQYKLSFIEKIIIRH